MRPIHALSIAIVVVMGLAPGCECSPGSVSTTVPNANPATTGAKVECLCTITASAAAQSAAGLAATKTQEVDACLPSDFAGQEESFCSTLVAQYMQTLDEQVALFSTSPSGGQLGQPSTTSSQTICGSTPSMPSYYGTTMAPAIAVTCTHQNFTTANGPQASIPDQNCVVQATGIDGQGDVCPGNDFCTLTSNPSMVPSPDNCLVEGPNFVPNECMCTIPNAQPCPGGVLSRPVCQMPAGSGDPSPLVTSPMSSISSRIKPVVIDHSASLVSINVDQPICVNLLLGTVCGDNVTGSTQTNVSGQLNLYGGPCPGTTCDITLDGLVYVDDFTLNTADSIGLFSESDNIQDVRIALSVPTAVIAVQPDGSAIIPAGELGYDATGLRNGLFIEQTGTSDNDTALQLDWSTGTLTINNLVEPVGESSGTLNLTGSFQPSLVEQFGQAFLGYDTDHDGVPDRIDNCPLVFNPTQVPVPPVFGAVPPVALSSCTPGGDVTLQTPPVTDPCFKAITITGAAVQVNGQPIVPPIPIVASGPIAVAATFDDQGLPVAPIPLLNGQVVLPAGTVTILWTAVDTNGAVSTVTQTISSSTQPTLYATQALNIGDGTIVQVAAGQLATVANAGSGTTTVGVAAQVGNVLSNGPVFLANNALVSGFLQTGGALTLQAGATVAGPVTQNDQGIVFPAASSVSVAIPSPVPAGLDLEPGQSGSLAPGAYGPVAVKEGSTLSLSPGTYSLLSLDLEPQSTVTFNSSQGSLVVLVQQSIIFNGGTVIDQGNPQAPDILLGYAGTQAVSVAAPFNGAIFAPNAALTLDTVSPGFTGQFEALDLTVGPHTQITHRAYHCSP